MASTVVQMPQLGESVVEGTIGRWLKQPGERVERDEPLVEIQTDKVNAEVPSPVAGVLQKVLLPEGATVAVKTDIAIIGDEALPEGGGDAVAAPAAEAEAGADVSGLALADSATGSAPGVPAPERSTSSGESSRTPLANGADTVRGEPSSPPPFRYDDAAAGSGGPTSSARAQASRSWRGQCRTGQPRLSAARRPGRRLRARAGCRGYCRRWRTPLLHAGRAAPGPGARHRPGIGRRLRPWRPGDAPRRRARHRQRQGRQPRRPRCRPPGPLASRQRLVVRRLPGRASRSPAGCGAPVRSAAGAARQRRPRSAP